MTELNQEELIINYMLKNGSITAFDAANKLKIMEFHARMTELRERGWVFHDEWETNKRTHKRYKRYVIIRKP